jgi:long-chain acyl-CoA synthetase
VSLRTSGTTGRPRQVIRTAASWVDSFPVVAQLIGLEGDSRAWVPGPLGATMNLYAAALATYLEASLVDSLSRASHAFLTPTGLIQLLAEPAPKDLHVIIAGDRLGEGLADRAAARGWRVSHYYGAAQLSFVAWGRDEASLLPFPEVAVDARTDGRLWVSSPWLCEQVIAPDGAPPAFQVEAEAGTGRRWATVGDRGQIAADGRVVVLGRDDVILTGGAPCLSATSRRCCGQRRVVRCASYRSRMIGWVRCWLRSAPTSRTSAGLLAMPVRASLARSGRGAGCIDPSCR